MASTSIRERLIKGLVEDIQTLKCIKTVKRIQPSDEADLSQYASTQLPLVAVIGGIPVPKRHKTSRGSAGTDKFVSTLRVSLFVYFLAGNDPDTAMSELLNDLWVKLYTDQTRNSLAIDTELEPQVEPVEIDPYVAFMIVVNITYLHDTGGI